MRKGIGRQLVHRLTAAPLAGLPRGTSFQWRTGWADHPVGVKEVVVRSPAVKHEIPVVRVTNWLRSAGSPKEVALKGRLREILGWKD